MPRAMTGSIDGGNDGTTCTADGGVEFRCPLITVCTSPEYGGRPVRHA